MNIFLAPRSNETSYKNFLSTIENGLDYSVVEPFLNDEGKKILSVNSKIFAWGNKESKKSSWDKMEIGDIVLFYKGREGKEEEGKFLFAGKLLYKQYSNDLGISLWPPKKGEEPWVCIFFLENLTPIYLPISYIKEWAGYNPGFIVQGFMPLNEKGTKVINEKYSSFENFVSSFPTTAQEVEKSDIEEKSEVTAHSEAELLLLKTGKMLGYDTYTPDKAKEAFGESLGDYTSLKSIPPRFLGELVPLIGKIDVIWFKDEIPKYAFEIEHTTGVGSGFQRLVQLHPLGTKMFVVSSKENYYLYEKFINANPYYLYKDHFYFRDYKQLEKFFYATSEFEKINNTFLD